MASTHHVQKFVSHECQRWSVFPPYGLKNSYARARMYVSAIHPSLQEEVLASLLLDLASRVWFLFDTEIKASLEAEILRDLSYYANPENFNLKDIKNISGNFEGFDNGICMGITTDLLCQKGKLKPDSAKGRYLQGQYWLSSAIRLNHFFPLEGKLFFQFPPSQGEAQKIKELFFRYYGSHEWKKEKDRDERFYSLLGRISLRFYPSRQMLLTGHLHAKGPEKSFWALHHITATDQLDFSMAWKNDTYKHFTCTISWFGEKGSRVFHILYFSPPIFIDPNDIDPATNQPRIHTFATREAAFLGLSFHFIANYAFEPDFEYFFYGISRLP